MPKTSVFLLKNSILVGTMTMLSRMLGLLRDVVFAHTIGAQAGADAFFVAFKIPNFLRRLFAEGAFAQAFVPVLAEYRQRGSLAAIHGLIDRVCGCLGMILLLLTLFVVVSAPIMTVIFAPGFWSDPVRFQLTESMLRLTFPYLFLIAMTGMAGAILNSYDRFAVPAFTPVLLNISLITTAIWLAPYIEPPVVALAWGVLIGGIVQLSFQIPFLWRLRLVPKPIIDWGHPGVKKILLLMGPAIFAVSVSQINLLLDTVLASLLPQGSVSWLYYSDRLTELPLGVFAIAIATVILPNLSRQHIDTNANLFSATLDWALRLILLVAIPAAVALVILAQPILITLFQYGRTTAFDVGMSALSLQAYSLGLVAFMLIKVLAPGYFARHDMKTPAKIGIIAMIVNIVFNIILVIPFHFFWQIGHVGLALATALSAFVNAGLLFLGLLKMGIYKPQNNWLFYLAKLFLANSVLAITLWLSLDYFQQWQTATAWQRVSQLLGICIVGLGVYLSVLLLSGLRARHFRISV